MGASKNILEFCLSPNLGGLEIFVYECYKHFKIYTNTYIIVAPNKRLDNFIDDKKTYIKRNKLLPIIPAIKLAKFIDKHNIDIIHFHWTKDMPTVVLGKLLSNKNPKIIQTRNMNMTRFKNDFYHKFLYKNISLIHCVTNQVKAQLTKFIPNDTRVKLKTIYMGTDVKKDISIKKDEALMKRYNLNKNDFIVGIVGRIEDKKGHYILIDAISKLDISNIKILIVGHTMDEKYLNNLKTKINNLGLNNKVIFTGFTKEVFRHFSLLDVNILATEKETFGLVIIEAMANKVAVIATKNGGPLEIIEDGKTGLLFNLNSDDLAKKIKILYDDKNLLKTISNNGYNLVNKKFNKTIQLNKLFNTITYA